MRCIEHAEQHKRWKDHASKNLAKHRILPFVFYEPAQFRDGLILVSIIMPISGDRIQRVCLDACPRWAGARLN